MLVHLCMRWDEEKREGGGRKGKKVSELVLLERHYEESGEKGSDFL